MIKVKNCTITKLAQIHVRSELLVINRTEHFFTPLNDTSIHYLKNLTKAGLSLVEQIVEINGFRCIQVGLHCVTFHLDNTHDWDGELEESVIKIVRQVCSTDEESADKSQVEGE